MKLVLLSSFEIRNPHYHFDDALHRPEMMIVMFLLAVEVEVQGMPIASLSCHHSLTPSTTGEVAAHLYDIALHHRQQNHSAVHVEKAALLKTPSSEATALGYVACKVVGGMVSYLLNCGEPMLAVVAQPGLHDCDGNAQPGRFAESHLHS